MTPSSLATKPATELAHLIRSKAVSPVEVIRATITCAEALNPRLNAICTPTYEAAMEAARVAEQAVMRMQPLGLLHGVPITLKDLTFTKGGRTIYAIGSNAEAARAAGLRVDFYSILVYVISGALSAVAAVFLAARILSIDPIAGNGLELDTIAGVVIGGASLFDRRGTIIGTFIGVLIMVLIRNGLNLLNVNPYWQGTAIGSIIVAAVLLERFLSAREGMRRTEDDEA